MRAVFDTNVLVSAFLFGGTPLDAVGVAESEGIEVITSEAALGELLAVLVRPRFRERLRLLRVSARFLVARYREWTVIVDPAEPPHICSDRSDDEFVGIPVAGGADVVVGRIPKTQLALRLLRRLRWSGAWCRNNLDRPNLLHEGFP